MEKGPKMYNTIYKEIAELLGEEAAERIYLLFRGQQITFPVRLYSSQMIKNRVTAEFDGKNIRELAKKYEYSEKTIRRMLRGKTKERDEDDPSRAHG